MIPATSFHRRRRRRRRSCTWYDAREADDAPGCASSGTVVSICSCFGPASLTVHHSVREQRVRGRRHVGQSSRGRLIGRKSLSLTVRRADLVPSKRPPPPRAGHRRLAVPRRRGSHVSKALILAACAVIGLLLVPTCGAAYPQTRHRWVSRRHRCRTADRPPSRASAGNPARRSLTIRQLRSLGNHVGPK